MRLLLACILLAGCGGSMSGPPRDPYAFPRNDCRAGTEYTYHSDGSWDLAVRSECGHAW